MNTFLFIKNSSKVDLLISEIMKNMNTLYISVYDIEIDDKKFDEINNQNFKHIFYCLIDEEKPIDVKKINDVVFIEFKKSIDYKKENVYYIKYENDNILKDYYDYNILKILIIYNFNYKTFFNYETKVILFILYISFILFYLTII